MTTPSLPPSPSSSGYAPRPVPPTAGGRGAPRFFAVVFGLAAVGSASLAFLLAALGTVVLNPDYPARVLATIAAHPGANARAEVAGDLAADMASDKTGAPELGWNEAGLAADLYTLFSDPVFRDDLAHVRTPDGDLGSMNDSIADVIDDYATEPGNASGLSPQTLAAISHQLRATEVPEGDEQAWKTTLNGAQIVMWVITGIFAAIAVGMGAASCALTTRKVRALAGLGFGVGAVVLWCLYAPVSLPFIGGFTVFTATLPALSPNLPLLAAAPTFVGGLVHLWFWVRRISSVDADLASQPSTQS